MKGRGRRTAILVGAGGALVLAAVFLEIGVPVLEGWHMARFRAGDREAKEKAARWMAEHGTERSLRLLLEHHLSVLPELLIARTVPDVERPLEVETVFAPRALSRFMDRIGIIYLRVPDFGTEVVSIRERLGEARWTSAAGKFLADGRNGSRLVTFLARIIPARSYGTRNEDPDLEAAALRILRAALASPDAYIRACTAYGLADAGPGGLGSLAAIEALEADPDEVVREAAELSAARLRDAGAKEAAR